MARTVRAVAYYRMSTDQQDKSIPQQQEWAQSRRKADPAEPIDIAAEFRDDAVSGDKTDKRADFHAMLAFCQKQHKEGRPIEAIVCYTPSRFSRADSHETASYIWQFRQAGVHRILTAERWFDWDKEEDRVLFNLVQDMTNHRYLVDLSRNICRGQLNGAKTKRWVGGSVAYGYQRMLVNEQGEHVRRLGRDEKIVRPKNWWIVLVPSENALEVETVRWIFDRVVSGKASIRQIARELTERGVPGPFSFTPKFPHKTPWAFLTVRNLLQNPIYCGDFRWGMRARGSYHRIIQGEVQPVNGRQKPTYCNGANRSNAMIIPNTHEAIIDRETWDRAQARMEDRKRDDVVMRRGGYPLSGVLYCGCCEGPMFGSRNHRVVKGVSYDYRRYVCATHLRYPALCGRQSIREDRLLDLLIRRLQEEYLAPERLEELRAELKRQATKRRQTPQPDDSGRLKAEIAALGKRIEVGRARALQAPDDATFALYNQQLAEWVQEKTKLEARLQALERTQTLPVPDVAQMVDEAVKRLETLRERLQQAKPELLAEVLGEMVARIDVYFEEKPKVKGGWRRVEKGVVKLRPQLPVFSSSANNAPADAGRGSVDPEPRSWCDTRSGPSRLVVFAGRSVRAWSSTAAATPCRELGGPFWARHRKGRRRRVEQLPPARSRRVCAA
jgi:DNA invertase Pin-like site-specific DNA recombinase